MTVVFGYTSLRLRNILIIFPWSLCQSFQFGDYLLIGVLPIFTSCTNFTHQSYHTT